MEKKLRNKRGISLIVLVITIIIMIIIAAAIILALNGSGILGRANSAKIDSDSSSKKEAATVALAEYDLLVNSNDSSVQNKTAMVYVKEKLEAQGIDTSDVIITDNRDIVVGITSLEGTTWRFKSKITYDSDLEFDIQGTVFNSSYSIPFLYFRASEEYGYDIFTWWYSLDMLQEPYENGDDFFYIPENEIGFTEGWNWGNANTLSISPTEAPSMTITGGDDIDNQELLLWLCNNAIPQ